MELPVKMQYDTSLAEQAYALAAKWDASRNTSDVSQLPFKASDLEGYGSNQIGMPPFSPFCPPRLLTSIIRPVVVFLERLHTYPALPASHITLLGTLYKLSSTTNAEIRLRFYEVAFMDPASAAAKALAPEAVRWVTGEDGTGVVKGRMKFCRPVFRDVSKVDRELAVKYWTGKRDSYHPIARRLIEKVRIRNASVCSPALTRFRDTGSRFGMNARTFGVRGFSRCKVVSTPRTVPVNKINDECERRRLCD